MNQIKTLVARLVQDEQGQDLIEYALLGALIAVGVGVGVSLLLTAIGAKFGDIANTITGS